MTPRDYIIKFCDDFKVRLLAKYDKGEKEHGDNWQGVNCNTEIAEEICDIVNYFMIHQAQLEKKMEAISGLVGSVNKALNNLGGANNDSQT